MKKVSMILILGILCGFAISQTNPPRFNLTKDGVNPVVLNFDESFTASKIYARLKTWNASLIKYPETAIRVDKENVQVKFAGYKDNAWKIRANNFDHWYTVQYTLNVEIKDGRCRVLFETPETKYKVWFNADGSTIPKFKESEASFEATINTLLTSLYTHIKNPPKKAEDNW
jgi:hypothetical protein